MKRKVGKSVPPGSKKNETSDESPQKANIKRKTSHESNDEPINEKPKKHPLIFVKEIANSLSCHTKVKSPNLILDFSKPRNYFNAMYPFAREYESKSIELSLLGAIFLSYFENLMYETTYNFSADSKEFYKLLFSKENSDPMPAEFSKLKSFFKKYSAEVTTNKLSDLLDEIKIVSYP